MKQKTPTVVLENKYESLCNTPSDINEHLPTLKKYADQCNHITELGVRWVVSTYALMMGKPKTMISYDIESIEQWDVNLNDLIDTATYAGIDFKFIIGDSTKINIDDTDLLFIDTWHAFLQLKTELFKHAPNVKKYIILHDTADNAHAYEDSKTHFAELPEIEPGDLQKNGLLAAVDDFIRVYPEWFIKESYQNNNGLMILEKK